MRARSPSLTRSLLSALTNETERQRAEQSKRVSVGGRYSDHPRKNSPHEFDVEVRSAELNVHPYPERNEHLQAACGGQVAEIEYVGPARSAASAAAVCRAAGRCGATKIVESTPTRAD